MSDREAFKAKLASLQFAGRGRVTRPRVIVDKKAGTKSIPVPDDDHGRHVGGYQVEHKDGHVDAQIHPEHVRLKFKPQESE